MIALSDECGRSALEGNLYTVHAGSDDAGDDRSERPRVSVLIPTFNRPHFLAAAIGSVVVQTAHDFELVVGDDGCDGGAVVDAFDDPRIRYQRNQSRLGVALNWEALIERATGQFLLLLMDDDRIEPTFIARCLEEFERDPELGVVFTNVTFAREERLTVRRCDLSPGRHDDFAEEFLKERPVGVSGALWKSTAWPSIRPLPDTAAADMVLFGRIADLGYPFFFINEPLMRYRVHETNYSSQRRFRDDRVAAWRHLSFRDAGAQRERDRLLSEALLSRAAAEIREGDLAAARSDATDASSLGSSQYLYGLGIRLAASHGTLARCAQAFARVKTAATRR